MLFNSIDFAIFLPLVFGLYWLIGVNRLKQQNWLLLIASYVFYGWWDWRFLCLILFSTLADYCIALGLGKESDDRKRKALLWLSLSINLGLLGIFKYYNFFLQAFTESFSLIGMELEASRLNVILPVGISFYTFQTLSYTIDVFKKKLEPTKDFISFAAFVSFFPQLVAGPIERASNLLPQFKTRRVFDYKSKVNGLRQILWGLFKKVVIADNCAHLADTIFSNSETYDGSTLVLGAIFFAFQIYGDFSGYSDIAIGTARLFGFSLMKNFAFPYFSRDIAEFWRRWHISLSAWFRDYVYIPLGGSKVSRIKVIRNVFIIFVVSGFWHGANWTFIFWGALNALYFIPLLLTSKNRNNMNVVAEGKWFPNFREAFQVLATFALTCLSWVFFRAESLQHAFAYISEIFSASLFTLPAILSSPDALLTLLLLVIFLLAEWTGRSLSFALEAVVNLKNRGVRWGVYCLVIFFIGMFMQTESSPFIYFQF